MADNGQDIEAKLSIILEDKFSTPMKKLNTELHDSLVLLAEIGNKLGSLENINLERLTREMKNVKDAALSINTPTHKIDVGSGVDEKTLTSLIRAEAGHQRVQNALGRKEVQNYDKLLEIKVKELEEKEKQIENRTKELENRLDKKIREDNVKADTENKSARARLNNAKADALISGGQMQYTSGKYGAFASILGAQNMRFKNKQGLVGYATRFGARLADNKESWFGKAFGKDSGINNLFGGALRKGTINGLGINAGGLALGGLATAASMAATNLSKFGQEAFAAFGQMQKLSTSMEVVYGSRTQSNEAFSRIQGYATRSPFGIEQTTEMAILLKQSGVYASELQKTLEMIGDVSSGNEEKMKRIANNYAQIQAIGHANMLDMRQFAYAGLPIYEEVAKTMGKTQAELRPLIQEGKVTAEIIEKTFQNMTGTGGTFYKAVNKGAKTYAARKINLEDIKNIEKANVGEFLWNFGGTTGNNSVAQSILSFQESIHRGFSDFWGNRKINQQEKQSMRYDAFLGALTAAYDKALREHNEPLLKEISSKLDKFEATVSSGDEIRAGFVQKGNKLIGLKNKTEVSDSFYDALYKEVTDILSQTKYSDMRMSQNGDGTVSKSWVEHLIQQGYLDNSIIFNNAGEQAYVTELLKELNDLIPTSKLRDNLEKLANNAKKAHLAFAIFTTNVKTRSNEFADTMNKLSGGADSLSSRHTKYKELWAQSPLGKLEKQRQDRLAYEAYKKDFYRAKGLFDTSANKFNVKSITTQTENERKAKITSLDKLDFLLNSGFITTTSSLKLDPDSLVQDKTESWKQFFTNLDNILPLLESIGYTKNSDLYKRTAKLGEYRGKRSSDKDTTNKFNKDLDSLFAYVKGVKDKDPSQKNIIVEQLVNALATKIDASALDKVADYNEDIGDKFISLWKRVFANATGWDAAKIWQGGGGIMREYQNFQNRAIVSGGVEGLVKSERSIADILANRMVSTPNINNQKVRQIDWEKTEASLLDDSVRIEHGTKETANVLSGLAETIQSQLSVYDKLKHDFIAVGEDWSNISKFGRAESERLEQAFGYKLSSDYDLKYNKDKGFVVTDTEGTIIGSVNELKEQSKKNEIADENLKTAIDNLEVDSIIPVLDEQRSALQSLTHVVNTANSIAQKSNEYQRMAIQTRAKAYGSSFGSIGSVYQGTLTTRKAGADRYVRQFLGDFVAQIADIDSDMKYSDFEKSNPSIAKNVSEDKFNTLKKTAEVFKGDDIERNANALTELVKTFPELFRDLVENAEKLARAEEQSELIKLNSGLLDSGKLGFWGGVGANGGNPNNTWLQNRFMKSIGADSTSYKEWSKNLTQQAFDNGDNELLDQYRQKGLKFIKRKGGNTGDFNKAMNKGFVDIDNLEKARSIIEELGGDFDKLTASINKSNMALSSVGNQLSELSQNISNTLLQFGTDAITSSLEIWGESMATGANASKDLKENFRELTTSLMSNLGVMITEAGLSMMIHANSAAEVAAGLGLAAMGGGFSFLSGYMNGMADDDKEDDQLQRLLKVKEDLADLLKQAREDAIYYENTMRHKTAISANKEFTTKKVNDAIITPSGNVISTHPDDYLIATKTPQTLVGRSGSPKINFNLIDKSTGIKVTTQKANYDEKTNTLNFEALIESKVQEVIATSKGDDAFAIRQARENGKSVIA